jgi:hypothetical protein
MADESPLEMAERHVREGETLIERQRSILLVCESDGRIEMADKARDLLQVMETTQTKLVAMRDRLRRLS